MRILHTKDTMSDIYLDALRIRSEVFMKEQGVPFEREVDKDEANTIHFVLYSDQKEAIATLRLLPLNDKELKLQRMAVLKNYRKQGLGKILILEAEDFAKLQGFKVIKLGAQLSAIPFYESLGYQAYGEEFIDAGIAHIHMKKSW